MTSARRIGAETILVAVLFCPGVFALQQATIRFDPETPLSPLEREPGELEAYEAVQNSADPARRLSRAILFLAGYPTSEFRHLVLRVRWEEQIELGDPERIVAAALEGLEAQEYFHRAKLAFVSDPTRISGLPEFRFENARRRAAYYQSIVEAYRDLEDFEKVVEYGEPGLTAAAEALEIYEGYAGPDMPEYQAVVEQNREVRAFILFTLVEHYRRNDDAARVVEYYERFLELTPDDVQTLMTASRMMVEEPIPEGEDSTTYLRRAQRYAERALERLEGYFSGGGAVDFDGGRRGKLSAEVQSILGLAHFRLGEWQTAADRYDAAIEAYPADPLFHYMRGLSSTQLGDVDAFLSAYARAVYLEIPQPEVRSDLETVYEARYGSLAGLEEFIRDEGARIPEAGFVESSPERTAYIDGLIERIDVLPTVFPPNRFCYQFYEFLASQDLGWAQDALEIGVGSGVNSFILLDRGAGRVVGTDINENAVRTFQQNASRFGLADRIEGRLVPLHEPEAFSVIEDDERFDLVISNPPWEDSEPRRIAEYAYLDSGWVLLRSMLEGLPGHLKENGRVWLLYGDPRVVPTGVPPAVEIVLREAPENNLDATVLYSNPRCSILELLVSE